MFVRYILALENTMLVQRVVFAMCEEFFAKFRKHRSQKPYLSKRQNISNEHTHGTNVRLQPEIRLLAVMFQKFGQRCFEHIFLRAMARASLPPTPAQHKTVSRMHQTTSSTCTRRALRFCQHLRRELHSAHSFAPQGTQP